MAIISAANPFDEEGILEALSTLANSSNVAFQLSAATAYEKTSIQDVEKVDSKTLRPLIPLLRSARVDVQTMALVALTKFAENNSNKKVIASSGALVPLLQLIKSSDIKVQLLALDTIAELVMLEENQKPMIDAGAIPIMVDCLKASNRDVRIGSGEILCQLAPDSRHVRDLFVLSADIVDSAIELSDCDNLLKKRFAARSFFNLGHDKRYQDEIVRRGGLTSLQKLLLSTDIIVVLLSLTCVNEISANSKHQTRLIDGDFIERLIELVAWKDTEEIQVLATSTLFRISNQSELGKAALVDARIAERIRPLVLSANPDAQTLMACVISTISDSGTEIQ
ncbi:Vacuolar protein 8 [Haplosporangium sp. Z 27]|nr:Vacuolar protein 8 [Haplosporangium sp. Z 27]